LEQLEELIVKDCRIEEINYLSRLCNLKILDLSDNSGIKTIKGLENLKNLTELIINDCFCVTKISGLDSLKNLKSLSLSSNQIEFMEGLEMLTNLQSLDLSSNKIEIFQGVENLNNLVELNLSYNEGIRIHIMEGSLPKLKVLKLNRCRIKDIDEISKLSQLKVLYIDDNNIESFVPINSLSNLKELSIENNKIPNPEFDGIFNRTMKYSDLSAIKSISGLEVLNLSNNNIVDITDLTNLPNLKELNLFLNKRLDIGPLGKITSLKKLELHYCDITDISVLKNLKNLTRLNIQKNQIDNFDSLEHLEKLKVILIDRNQIKPLSNLSKNSRLHHLFYCYKKNSNELTKICELEKESDLENQRKFREKQQSEAKKLVDDTIAEINKYFTSDNYANYIKERNSESSKWFSEDYIDQELYAFFNDIKNKIVYAFKEENEVNEDPEEFLANPICDIDPNNYIDAAITEAASESHSRFGNDFVNLEDLINAYAEDFFTNACKWMMIHLDDFLLEYFMMHALKFSPESIEKLVDAGVRNILHSQFSLIHIDLSGMEHWMIYLDEIFATCETASLDYQKYIEELKNELAE
jgi:Leucine-rich repeat (LRR) protein